MMKFILFHTVIIVVECFELLVIPLETNSYLLSCCAFMNQINPLDLSNCVTEV